MLETAKDALKSAFSNKITWAALVAIPLIVALLGVAYPATFLDPYGRMKELPVAIVNEDAGAVVNGEEENYGRDMVESILENDQVAWVEEDAGIVEGGLENTRYYFAVVVPEDFSEKVASGKAGEPEVAQVAFYKNQRRNYMMSLISSQVESKLRDTVDAEIAAQYATALAEGLEDAAEGFADGADGAAEIAGGADELAAGLEDAEAGVGDLSDGANSLSSGLGSAKDGASSLASGAGALEEGAAGLDEGLGKAVGATGALGAGAASLEAGAGSLAEGLGSAKEQVAALESAIGSLQAGAETAASACDTAAEKAGGALSASKSAGEQIQSAAAALQNLETALQSQDATATAKALAEAKAALEGAAEYTKSAATGAGYAQKYAQGASDGAGQIAGGAKEISGKLPAMADALASAAEGVSSLESGVKELGGGMGTLGSALDDASAGSASLASGASKLAAGATGLSSGIGDAKSGAEALAAGAGALQTGLGSALDGSAALADGAWGLGDGLAGGKDAINGALFVSAADMGAYVSEPVDVEEDIYGELDSFGFGFSPLFLSMAMWLGALLIFFVATPYQPRPFGKTGRVRAVFGRWPLYLVFSAAEVLCAWAACAWLGLPCASSPSFVAFLCMMAFSFMCIMQMLNLFDVVGKAIAIVVLILQIVCCAGTFPVELAAPYAAEVNRFLPFTYTIDGIRALMNGETAGNISTGFLVLAIYAAASVALSLLLYPLGCRMRDSRDARTALELRFMDGAAHSGKVKEDKGGNIAPCTASPATKSG